VSTPGQPPEHPPIPPMPAPSPELANRLRSARHRRSIITVIVGGVVIVALFAYGLIASRRSATPARPATPTGLHADAQTCAPPECHTIGSTVTLTWAPPAGETITAYHLFRDGLEMKTPSGSPLTMPKYVDDTATFGVEYHYTVSATGADGTSGPSDSVAVTAPDPPKSVAQLSGEYRVLVTVQHVSFLKSLEGITNPAAGDTKKETWSFTPKCAVGTGPCDTAVNLGKPPLHRQGSTYTGSITREGANCLGAPDVPARISFHLATDGAVRDPTQGWRIRSFSGTYTVTLACGGYVSSATLTVHSLGH
jgi:hypothetical protein